MDSFQGKIWCQIFGIFVPPTLVEQVIFLVHPWVSVPICLCVCVHPMYLKFHKHIKDHHISEEFEGQGHKSKVNVTKLKPSIWKGGQRSKSRGSKSRSWSKVLRSAVGKTHDLRSDLWWTIPLRILLGQFGDTFGSHPIKSALARHSCVQVPVVPAKRVTWSFYAN